MARSVVPLLIVSLLLLTLSPLVPGAEAAHKFGHRFMVYGQILDADGEPAQGIPVTFALESTQEPHPQLTVFTDCAGLFYNQQQQAYPGDHRTEQGRLHIHNPEWASDPDFIVATPYADYREDALEPQTPLSEEQLRQYAIHVGKADHRGTQSAHVNVQLDETVEPSGECEGESTENVFVVHGKVQKRQAGDPADQTPDVASVLDVTVTVETTEGVVEETVRLDTGAIYTARFDNVTLAEGARITAEWDGNERSERWEGPFRSVGIDILVRDWFWQSAGFQIFAGIVLVLVVAGVIGWGVTRTKDRVETKKAMERSTRKRANK